MRLMQLFLLVVAVTLATPAWADGHEAPPDLADMWIVEVRAGHDKDFREAFKEHIKFRAKKGDTRVWKTYSPMLGDDLSHYAIRACCVTYAEMDDYAAWSEKAKAGEHWNDNVDQYVESYEHYFSRLDLANSHWPEDDSGFKMFGVTDWKVKPGHGAQVEAAKAMLSKHAKEGEWPRHWSWSSPIGGKSMLTLVSPYTNFADMQGPAGGFGKFLSDKVGEEEAAKMFKAFNDNFHGSTYTVYRLVEEMSMKD